MGHHILFRVTVHLEAGMENLRILMGNFRDKGLLVCNLKLYTVNINLTKILFQMIFSLKS